jgi:hypothetical protein
VNATDEIAGYVDAVRAALADLPDGVRAELTDDLAEHLGEVLADGDGTLEDRLGTPQAYAAELRAAAGVVGGFPDPPAPDRWARLRQTVRTNLAAADVRVGPLLGYPTAGEFLRLLRPAWWVLRGYLAAMVLAAVLDDSGQPTGLLPRIGGSEAVAVLLLAACILGSVWLGRRPPPRAPLPRYALHAATVVLILVAVGGFANADSSSRGSAYEDVRYDNPYGGIQDVFVYDAQGRLLTGCGCSTRTVRRSGSATAGARAAGSRRAGWTPGPTRAARRTRRTGSRKRRHPRCHPLCRLCLLLRGYHLRFPPLR